MKALSVMPDYAMLLALGIKTVECRTWSTPYRGDVLICSSGRKADGLVSGHALCVVTLESVEPFEYRHLIPACIGFDDYEPTGRELAWKVGNVRLVRPFPVKGRLHLFEVPDDSIEVVGPPSRELVEGLFFPVMGRSRNSRADVMWLDLFQRLGWR